MTEDRPGDRDPVFASPLGRLLAVALALPSLLLLVGRGGADWYLIVPAFLGARLVGGRDDARLWAAATALALPLAIVPVLAGTWGFALERVWIQGALAALAWRGALAPRPTDSAWTQRARLALLGWLAWSAGAAVRGCVLDLPAGAPWVGHVFRSFLLGMLEPASPLEPTAPLAAWLLRLDTVLVAWAGLEIARRRPETPRLFVTYLLLALPLALVAAVADMALGAAWRGDSLLHRLAVEGVPRSHRPLGDHNALGSAMLIALPVVAWRLVEVWRAPVSRAGVRFERVLAALALVSALALLYSTRSKSAFVGLVVAVAAGAVLTAAGPAPRLRRPLGWVVAGIGLALVGVNLIPAHLFQHLENHRRVEDLVRAVRHDAALPYLRKNRYAVWEGGAAMVGAAPWSGVGLGNFPRRLSDHHDPSSPAAFNPLHENAHCQFLQWAAEEGLVGLLLGLIVLGLALRGGWSGLRAPPADESGRGDPGAEVVPLTAALAGLCVNLLVGHALLVLGVAILFGANVGLLLAQGAVVPGARAPRRTLLRFGRLRVGAFALIAAAPLLVQDRADPEEYGTGCYPWIWSPGSVPDRARTIAADARWIQRWGEGSRMLIGVIDVRPPQVEGVQRVRVLVNDRPVLEGVELPRATSAGVAPPTWLKVDAPPGVGPGDLVQVRVESERSFAESLAHGRDQAPFALRMLPPVFRDPGR